MISYGYMRTHKSIAAFPRLKVTRWAMFDAPLKATDFQMDTTWNHSKWLFSLPGWPSSFNHIPDAFPTSRRRPSYGSYAKSNWSPNVPSDKMLQQPVAKAGSCHATPCQPLQGLLRIVAKRIDLLFAGWAQVISMGSPLPQMRKRSVPKPHLHFSQMAGMSTPLRNTRFRAFKPF